jgi:GT2 family glycosyltransferase
MGVLVEAGEPEPPVSDELPASVIICAYSRQRWGTLRSAVKAVQAGPRPPYELIVVIDHNDQLLDQASRDLAGAIVIPNTHPRGLSGARNTGVARATGELVVFLDDDARPDSGWLSHLTAPFRDPSVIAVSGLARPCWDGEPPAWLPPEFYWVVGCSYRGLPEVPAEIRNPIGANMAFRRSVVEAVGGFIDGIGRVGKTPLGCEETDLAIRARSHTGGQVIHAPAARVEHQVTRSRCRWRYFRSRCFAEGLSKAIVARRLGSGSALSSERAYVRRTLPAGVARGLWDALRGERAGVYRSGAIIAGLLITLSGYLLGRISALRVLPRRRVAAPARTDEVHPSPPEPNAAEDTGSSLVERLPVSEPDHLARTAGALVLNTAATSALGVAYWVIAAHFYTPTELARNSALISCLLTLSGVCQLNMSLGLGALLPRAGRLAGRVLAQAYLTVSLFSLLVLAGFVLLVLPHISSLHSILTGPAILVSFIGAVLLYNIFALQDSALSALRSASIVPVENALFGVAKIAIVVGVAAVLPRTGIFFSWAFPLAFLVLPISGYLFARVAPRQRSGPNGNVSLLAAAKPVTLDYVGYLFLAGSTLALPALVFALLGAKRGATFSVAYLTSSSLDLIAVNIGVALTVEASHARDRMAVLLRRTLTRGLPFVGLLSGAGVLAAPLILHLYGSHYAATGTPLLRLLLAGALPRAVVVLAISRARAERRMSLIVRTQALTCLMVIGGAVTLGPRLGLVGIGMAWLAAQATAALTVIPSLVKSAASELLWRRAAKADRGPHRMTPTALASRPRPSARGGLGLAVPLGAILATLLVAHRVDPSAVGSWGLITVTPWPIFLIGALLSLSFFATLRRPGAWQVSLAAHLLGLALLLHGLPALLEQEPRFPTAWLHAGFVSQFITGHHPLPLLDGRFAWPGFFTAAAALVGLAGRSTAVPLLRWTPFVLNLAYLLPIFLIAKTLLGSRRRAWVVAWLFLLTNWAGQDYFSPQGFAYFLFLGIIALLVYAFSAHALPPGVRHLTARLRHMISSGAPPAPNLSPRQRAAVFAVLILAAIALNMSHQLTPVVLTLDVGALVLGRRCSLRFYAVILAVLLAGWISWAAAPFWSGHLSTLFGSGGTHAVSANLSQRVRGGGGHLDVVYERIAFSGLVWLIAAGGAFRSALARRPLSLTALILALLPFPIVLAQAYGGEAEIRLYFYTLPFMLILAVCGPAPAAARSRRLAALLALISLAFIPLLLVARFGNEEFEQVRPAELAAAQRLYDLAPRGATLVSITPQVVWRYKDFDGYDYRPNTLDEFELGTPKAILSVMGTNPRGSYLLITQAQTTYATLAYGLPSNWGQQVERLLARQPDFHLLYSNPVARIYSVSRPTGSPQTAPLSKSRLRRRRLAASAGHGHRRQ